MDVDRFQKQLQRNAHLLHPQLQYIGYYMAGGVALLVLITLLLERSVAFLAEYYGEIILALILAAITQRFMRFQLETVALLRKHGILRPSTGDGA